MALVRLVIARCSVDYAGRLSAHLPPAIRLLIVKADGSVLFNSKSGRIESSAMKLKLTGTLSIEIGGQTTEVNLEQDQDSSVENSDKTLLPETKKP